MDIKAQVTCSVHFGCSPFHFRAAELAIECAGEIEKTLNPYNECDYISNCCSAIIASYSGFEAKINEKIGFIEHECCVVGNKNNELVSFLNEIDLRGKTMDKYKKIIKLFSIDISCKEYDNMTFIQKVRDQLVHSKGYSKTYCNDEVTCIGQKQDEILDIIDKYLHHPEVKKFRSPFNKNNDDNFPHLITNALFSQWCLDTIKKFIENSTVNANSIRDYFPPPRQT